jgi:short subunit dehydrogenase-like uncharacterized protein
VAQREHDLVLFGATGFTGALTAEYLARNAPDHARWALAGRNRGKLEQLRERLGQVNPKAKDLPLLIADVTDAASLAKVAAATKVVITTVGPYLHHGEPLVAACAEAGTDYVDLTGEPEFVDRMYLAHHGRATETGARIVHACGFDSIPYDLGVYYTVQQLGTDEPISIDSVVRTNASFSGGTFASALTAFSRLGPMRRVAKDRRAVEPREAKVHLPVGVPHYHRPAGVWAVPLPTVDPQIVGRSAAALRYAPDFTYREFLGVSRLPTALAFGAGAAGLIGAAQVPPLRKWLQDKNKPGDGPSEERRAKSRFSVTFYAKTPRTRLVTEVSGGDPGYDETAKMLSESALCLAFDDLAPTAGQVTTATAMGGALVDRLVKAGITFRTRS